MAIKLTQGADSTIVTAATRAGLATSPKDYSDTFQSVADSYAKSQEAAAEAWGQISGTIALVGAELQKNAEVYSDQAQRVYDAGGTEELVDELYNIKDELKALGSFGGKFGDRETRRKRSQLLAKRSKLFAEIDGWGESLEEASLASKNGLLDYDLMGGDVEFVNAIIASNTNNKVTSEGNIAKVTRDSKTGELMYTLHKEDGTAIPGKTMSLSTFKTLIKDSAKDVDNVMGTTLSAITNNAELYGATYGGTLDKYNRGKLLTSIDNITKNVPGLRRAMRSKFGHSGTSFFDELTGPNQTELSSKYFTLMLEDIANTTINKETGKKEIKADALSEDLDANKDGSISQQEINDQYVLFQNSILTGEGPMAKKLFTDFVVKRTEEAYEFGAKQKNKKSGTKDDDTDLDFYSKGKGVMLHNKQIITGSSAESLYTAIRDGIEFEEVDPLTKKQNKYSYKTIDGVSGWYENYEEGDTPKSVQFIGSGSNLAAKFTNDSRFRNLQTVVEERIELGGVTKSRETRIEGDYSTNIASIDIDTMNLDDNNVADKINQFLPPIRDKSNPKGYVFYTTQMGRSEGISFERGGGDFTRESVMLYQLADQGDKTSFTGPDGYRIKPVVINGKVIEIKTGGSLQRRRKAIEDLDALFNMPEFKGLMLSKPRP